MFKKIVSLAVISFLAVTQVAAWDDRYCRENKVRCNSNANAFSSSEDCNVRYMACQWSNIWIKSCDPAAPAPTPPPAQAYAYVQSKVKQHWDSRQMILEDCQTKFYTCDEKAGDPADTQECNLRYSACRRSQFGTWVPMCPAQPEPAPPAEPAPAPAKVHHRHHQH